MAEEFPFPFVQPVDPNIGRRVDHTFVIRALLARGGMGGAYIAEHELMAHVKCVIKVVLADLANQPAVMARWSTETTAVSRLKHVNIVRLHNFGWLDDGQPFMRFEYIEGQPLHKYIAARAGRIPIRDALYIIFQVCDALAYAHELGIVHRDLKPDNLMIEADPPGWPLPNRVTVLDFGIAKVMSPTVEQTAAGVIMGTPGYMAPEQATNAAAVDGKADVFALATVFYFAVTGMMPWGPVESDVAICLKQHTEPPIVPPAFLMPPEVAEIVLRGLSLRPEARPTMQEFAQWLAAALPAEGRLRSGIDILREVKRIWADSLPPHGPTMPRPVTDAEGEPPPLPMVHENAASLSAQAHENVASVELALASGPALPVEGALTGPQLEPKTASVDGVSSVTGPKRRSSQNDLVITANVRRRPAAMSLAAPDRVTVTPSTDVPLEHGPAPAQLAPADLPTGSFLLSQRYPAQEAPPDADVRAPSVIVASEFEVAIGTPLGPHGSSQLPAVVVSNTLLTGGASEAKRNGSSSESSLSSFVPPRDLAPRLEPPPILVLPRAPRSPRNLLIGAATTVCVVAVITGVMIARHHATIANTDNDSFAALAGTMHRSASHEGTAPQLPAAPVSTPNLVSNAAAAAPGPTAEAPVPAPPSAPKAPILNAAAADSAPARATEPPSTAHVPTTPRSANPNTPRLPVPNSSPSIPTGEPAQKIRVSTPRTPGDSVSAVMLVIRVRGFAKVSIDGDEPVTSPRRKQVQPGTHHVAMSGYPEGSDEKQIKEFDISVPAGRPEIVISKTW